MQVFSAHEKAFEPNLLQWAAVTAAGCAAFIAAAWLSTRRRLFQMIKRLIAMLKTIPPGTTASAYADLLHRSAFDATPRPWWSADIKTRLPTKWRLQREKKSSADIHAAAERVLARKEGQIIPAGLGLRWSHKKSPWTVTFRPCGAGAEVEVGVDRTSYSPFYTVILFVFGFIGWLVLRAMLSGDDEAGAAVFPGGLFMGLASPLLGMLANFMGCVFYRFFAGRLVRRFVHELEELPAGRN